MGFHVPSSSSVGDVESHSTKPGHPDDEGNHGISSSNSRRALSEFVSPIFLYLKVEDSWWQVVVAVEDLYLLLLTTKQMPKNSGLLF